MANTEIRDVGLTVDAPGDRAPAAEPADARHHFCPQRCEPGLTLELVTERDAQAWDRAERFVYQIFRVSSFCEPSPREWVEEVDAFRPGSTFHTIIQDGVRIVGAARTMLAPYGSLPIGRFPSDHPVTAGLLCEIGSLAVRPNLRGLGVVNELHRSAFQWALRQGADGLAMLVEPWSIDFFRDVYGLPLVQTAEPRDYMGSLTVPAVVRFDEMLEALVRDRPGVFEWAIEGLEPDLWRRGDLPVLLR